MTTNFGGGTTFSNFDNTDNSFSYLNNSNPRFLETSPHFKSPTETNISDRTGSASSASNNTTNSQLISDAIYNPIPPEYPKGSQTQRSPRFSNASSAVLSSSNTPSTSRSSSNSNFVQTLFNTQKAKKSVTLKDKALRGEPIYDLKDSEYESLLADLVEERRQLAASYKFKESTQVTNAIRHVEACQIQQQKYELQVEAVKEYDEQVADFQRRLAEFDSQTEKLEVELRGKLAEQRKRILILHQKELDKHVQKWSSDAMRRQYNHASFKLRALQKQFRLLMLECRFTEAEPIKATIDRMQKREQQDAMKQMQLDFEESTNKLKAKLDLEMTSYEQRGEVQIRQLQQKREWLRLSFLNKERKFEQKAAQVSDQEKLWNTHQLQRKEELAKGKNLSAPNTSNRLSDEDVKDREVPTLQLPPLFISTDMSKTNR